MRSDLDYTGSRVWLVGSRVLDADHHVQETEHHHHHHGHHGHTKSQEKLADPVHDDRPLFKKVRARARGRRTRKGPDGQRGRVLTLTRTMPPLTLSCFTTSG
jgi:hypothetical protein